MLLEHVATHRGVETAFGKIIHEKEAYSCCLRTIAAFSANIFQVMRVLNDNWEDRTEAITEIANTMNCAACAGGENELFQYLEAFYDEWKEAFDGEGVEIRVNQKTFTGRFEMAPLDEITLGYELYCAREDSAVVAEAIAAAADTFEAPRLTTLEVYVRSLPMEKGLALRQDYHGLTPFEARRCPSADGIVVCPSVMGIALWPAREQ